MSTARSDSGAEQLLDCDDIKDVLRAIAEGHPCHGYMNRYIVVENPAFKPDNGSDPNLVLDTWSPGSAQEPLDSKTARWLERARETQCCDAVIDGLLGQAIEIINASAQEPQEIEKLHQELNFAFNRIADKDVVISRLSCELAQVTPEPSPSMSMFLNRNDLEAAREMEDLSVWCLKHPKEAAGEIRRLRAAAKTITEDDGSGDPLPVGWEPPGSAQTPEKST